MANLMDGEQKPWELQKGESGKAYAAFRIFRDLGLGRTLAGCRSVEHHWSWKWKWRARCAAWDVEWCRRRDEALLDGLPAPVLEEPPPAAQVTPTEIGSTGYHQEDASGSEALDLAALVRELDGDSPWTAIVRALAEYP